MPDTINATTGEVTETTANTDSFNDDVMTFLGLKAWKPPTFEAAARYYITADAWSQWTNGAFTVSNDRFKSFATADGTLYFSGLTDEQKATLHEVFAVKRVEAIQTVRAEQAFDEQGFNKEGKDREGFDTLGFKNGFNRQGFNRAGYNADGYDAFGFDKFGFTQYGLDRDGFDISGWNADRLHKLTGTCFDTAGLDRLGFDAEGKDGFGRQRNEEPVTRRAAGLETPVTVYQVANQANALSRWRKVLKEVRSRDIPLTLNVKEETDAVAPSGVGIWADTSVQWNQKALRFLNKDPAKSTHPEVATRMIFKVAGGLEVAKIAARAFPAHGYPASITHAPAGIIITVDVENGVLGIGGQL